MPRGGAILKVDLTEGKIEKEPTSSYVDDWFGGDGIGGRIIVTEVPPETKGTDPENLLTFNMGPLCGTLRGSRGNVIFRSTQTVHNILAISGLGGQLPSELKFAGYDNVIIKGKADKPVYLFINDEKVEIRDAGHLWGLDTYETQARIKQELNDPDVQIACIGVAGENQVAYSIILHDINQKAGRGGGGAVMGSKNLKAIAVRGTKGLKVADPDKWLDIWNEWFPASFPEKLAPNHWTRKSMANSADYQAPIDIFCWGGDVTNLVCPTIPEEQKLEKFVDKYYASNYGCAFCPEQCQVRLAVPHIGSGATLCGVPGEFQTRFKMYDSDHWWRCCMLSVRLGLDVQATCNIISWLMRLHEEGIITAADTDGIPMEWGSSRAVLTMIEKIARKEGYGQIVADGIVPAARTIGKDAKCYARHVKGMETLNYWLWPGGQLGISVRTGAGNPHADTSGVENAGNIIQAILTAHPPVPGMTKEDIAGMVEGLRSAKSEHMCGDADAWRLFEDDGETIRTTGKAALVFGFETQTRLADLAGVCDLSTGAGPRSISALRSFWEEMGRFLTADLGVEYTPDMLREIVSRMRLQERGYDYLCGLRREDEVLPDDYFEPMKTRNWGTRAFMTRDALEKMKTEYYTLLGCDPVTGAPSRERLEQLGLEDMAERLSKLDLSPKPVEEAAVCEEASAKQNTKSNKGRTQS